MNLTHVGRNNNFMEVIAQNLIAIAMWVGVN